MNVTISDIPEEGVELDLNERLASGSVVVLSPIKAFLKLDKHGSDVVVKGVLSAEIELQCSRCLKVFSTTVKSRIDVIFHPEVMNKKEESHQLKEEELDSEFYEDDTLDVDNLLIEQLILAMPMRTTCSADCKGLCPICGADLNATKCNCKTFETDPRLKVLETLLKRKE